MHHDWSTDCSILQCIDCGRSIAPATPHELRCGSCGRAYPIHAGILEAMNGLDGNNRIALDLYNSQRWRRTRLLEKTIFVFLGGERRARSRILEHFPSLRHTRLLEVAIGDGANLPALPDDCDIYGVDISRPQLEECRRQFPRRPLRLLVGEAERLPFENGTFHNVLSVGGFNHFSNPLQSLREMARVTRPGGYVLVSDERPDFADGLLQSRWGRVVLNGLFGRDFTGVVAQNRSLQLGPIATGVLEDWKIHPVWGNRGYCLIGRAAA